MDQINWKHALRHSCLHNNSLLLSQSILIQVILRPIPRSLRSSSSNALHASCHTQLVNERQKERLGILFPLLAFACSTKRTFSFWKFIMRTSCYLQLPRCLSLSFTGTCCSSPDALLCPSQACAAPPPSECQHPPRVFLLWNSSWGRYCQLKRRVHISGSTGQSMGHPQKMATWFSVSVGTLAYFINQEVLFQRTNVERGHIIGLRNYVSLMINKSLPQWEGVPWNLCPQMHSQTTRRLTLGGYWMGK